MAHDVYDIVMLANGHPLFDTRIFLKEARTLRAAGYSVCLIIPAKKNEERDGVSILAVEPSEKGWRQLIINPWKILKKAFSQPSSSVYHIHDSDILLVGVVLKLLGRKVIYDAHEDTPLQIRYQHWVPDLLKRPYAWFYFLLEKICGWMFDRIIVAEPVIARYFPKRKTYLIRNFPTADVFARHIQTPYLERRARIIHVGSLTRVRGLVEMLEAAKIASANVDFEFLLGGKFAPPDLEKQISSTYQFNFAGWVSYNRLVDLLFDSRIGIIIPHPLERYRTNYPVKLFEFMAAGLPVIASKEGESAAFVREAECGILVDPLDTREIAAAMTWLLSNAESAASMGARGQQLIMNQYNWEKESNVLLDLYSGLRSKR